MNAVLPAPEAAAPEETHASSWQELLMASDPSQVPHVLAGIENALVARQYPIADVCSIRIAVEEALINAVVHGNQSNPAKQVRVAYRVRGDRCDVCVTDEGPGFDPRAVADVTVPENISQPCFRGLHLMRHAMSAVMFNERGNSVSMSKFRETPMLTGRTGAAPDHILRLATTSDVDPQVAGALQHISLLLQDQGRQLNELRAALGTPSREAVTGEQSSAAEPVSVSATTASAPNEEFGLTLEFTEIIEPLAFETTSPPAVTESTPPATLDVPTDAPAAVLSESNLEIKLAEEDAPDQLGVATSAEVPALADVGETDWNHAEAMSWFEKGRAHQGQGELKAAIEDFGQALKYAPQFTEAYNKRGNAYLGLGKVDKAIADYDAAIGCNSQIALLYANRGLAHAKKEAATEAFADAEKAIALDPQLALAFFIRGTALAWLNRPREAVADFTEAIRIEPNYALAYNGRGLAYVRLEDYAQAIADYRHAQQLEPKNILIKSNLASAYQLSGQHDLAVAEFNLILLRQPRSAEAYYFRGLSHTTLGNLPQAIADFTRTLKLDPKHTRARANLETLRPAPADAKPARPRREGKAVEDKSSSNGTHDARPPETAVISSTPEPEEEAASEAVSKTMLRCQGCGAEFAAPGNPRSGRVECLVCGAPVTVNRNTPPTPMRVNAATKQQRPLNPNGAKKTMPGIANLPDQPGSAKKRGAVAAAVTVAAAVLIGVGLWMKAPRTASHGPRLDADLPATELFRQCLENASRANSRFGGKILLVRGIVEKADTEQDKIHIVFQASDQGGLGVECFLDQKIDPATVRKGDTLFILGTFGAHGASGTQVQLDGCRIVGKFAAAPTCHPVLVAARPLARFMAGCRGRFDSAEYAFDQAI